jgi:hypothetical protein
MKRRNFIKVAVAAPGFENTISRGMGRKITISKQGANNGLQLPHKKDVGEFRFQVLHRPLGSTGQLLPAIGLGGSQIGKPSVPSSESVVLN